MSMLIFFSYLVGLLMKEWKNVTRRTYATLIIALLVLVTSFVIMTYGTMQGNEPETSVSTHENVKIPDSFAEKLYLQNLNF
jgi:L-rhamnose-H+ transport protein